MKLTETILHKAALYPVVAFDVFDTLIKRDVARPTDLVRPVGRGLRQSPHPGRSRSPCRQKRGSDSAEIYARPCLAGYDPAAECAAEIACAVPNLPVLKAARALHARGKRLYYISDMYLPKVQLDAMLAKCGYDFFDGGFVSADYGVQKRSGKLFRLFLQKTQTQAPGKRGPFYWRQLAGGCCRFGAGWHPQLAPSHAGGPAGKPACWCGGGFHRKPSAGHRIRGRAPWLCHSRPAGCSLLPMAACLGTAAPQCQNPLSGARYVPDAPGLRAFVPAGADRLLGRSPAAACARFYWRSTGGICCWPLCRANPLPVRRSPPIAVPLARWTCKKNPMI